MSSVKVKLCLKNYHPTIHKEIPNQPKNDNLKRLFVDSFLFDELIYAYLKKAVELNGSVFGNFFNHEPMDPLRDHPQRRDNNFFNPATVNVNVSEENQKKEVKIAERAKNLIIYFTDFNPTISSKRDIKRY
jgi:hypothetical protein